MKRVCMLLLVLAAVLFAGTSTSVFAGDTKVSGVIFANLQLHLNNQGLGKNYSAFDISRARLIADHEFSDKYSANLMIDIMSRSENDEYGLQYRLRSAYIQADKLISNVHMRFGMQGLLWFDAVEKVWGLRYVDALSLDKLGYLSRADLGFTAWGECPGNYGTLGLDFFNGSGYTKTEMNKYKSWVGFLNVTPFPKNPDFSEVGFMAQYYKGWPNIVPNPGPGESFSKNTKMDRMNAGVVFKYRKWLTLYNEYFHTWDDADVSNTTDDPFVEKAKGFESLAKINIATSETWLARVYVFGKYDWLDKHLQITKDSGLPNWEFTSEDGDGRFLMFGVGYMPVEGYELALTIQRNTIKTNSNNVEIVEKESNSFLLNMTAKF